jgi:hypothetical protein
VLELDCGSGVRPESVAPECGSERGRYTWVRPKVTM